MREGGLRGVLCVSGAGQVPHGCSGWPDGEGPRGVECRQREPTCSECLGHLRGWVERGGSSGTERTNEKISDQSVALRKICAGGLRGSAERRPAKKKKKQVGRQESKQRPRAHT